MTQSILDSVKKNLGLDADYTAFDMDVLTHINTTFLVLQQLGVGPAQGYMIEDRVAVWEDYLGGDPNMNAVKTFMYFKVRLAFDPPATSFAIAAMEKQAEELGWRLNVEREQYIYVPPTIVNPDEDFEDLVLDGGAP